MRKVTSLRKVPVAKVVPVIDESIRTIREQRVILDSDLAKIYGVPTSRFNEAVKRQRKRFPKDFLFQLSAKQHEALISQSAISKTGRGGRRTRPLAFTEHGAFQAANVLNSDRAQAMSVYVIRAFVRMREALTANQTVALRISEIETTLLTHDSALRDLFQKIRPLLLPPPEEPKPKIGFHPEPSNSNS